MYNKYNKIIFNPKNHFFNLFMNLLLDSSPCFNKKIKEFHKKTFSNLVYGDGFASIVTIGMYYDLFHVLETKFQSKEVKMML